MTRPAPKSEEEKQIYYRDARHKDYYGDIWTSTGKCVFCDLRDKYVVFEEDGMVLTTSLYAYIDGDMMIVPRRHVENASELTQQEWEAVRKLMHISRKVVRKVYGIRAINFIQRHGGFEAQSTVPHFHIKVIPFDAPDLAKWNYRKLSHTPLENTEMVRAKRKFVIEQSVKFDSKYSASEKASISLVLIAKNEQGQYLVNDEGELPRYVLKDLTGTIEQNLLRLVSDELGVDLKEEAVQLLASRIIEKRSKLTEPHLKVTYGKKEPGLENIYLGDLPADIASVRPASALISRDAELVLENPHD